jgi:hypothetical protein
MMAVSETSNEMESQFTRRAVLTTALIVGLLGLHQLPGHIRHSNRVMSRLDQVISSMSDNNMSREELDALVAGYYEGILRTDNGALGLPSEKEDILFRNDFLRDELKPNLNHEYKAGIRFTNSLGMANPEYSYQKPAHTRRIAILGDSVSLGPYGHDYVKALEDRLNQNCASPDIQNYQVLNFSVYGYSVLQDMDVGLNKASYFHPDVYVVALSSLEFFPRNGSITHVAGLLTSGTDLKYDYLRHVVAEAGIQPGNHLPAIREKLAPYLIQVISWALVQLRGHAAAEGAKMIIIMVPAPISPTFTSDHFSQLQKAAEPVGVPIIDMRDTFRSVNLDDFQVDPGKDIHPNARGHAMIADSLFTQLQAQPDALLALAGHSCQVALSSSAMGK